MPPNPQPGRQPPPTPPRQSPPQQGQSSTSKFPARFFQWPQKARDPDPRISMAARAAEAADNAIGSTRRIAQNLILMMIALFLAFLMAWGLYRSAQFLYYEMFDKPWTSKTKGG